MQLYTACVIIAWFSGYRWLSPFVAVFAAWPLLLVGALLRTLLDTGLRLRMRPAQLRNLHAILSVLSIVSMYLAFSLAMKGKAEFMLGVARAMPEWLTYTPAGLAVLALNERSLLDQLLLFAALFAEVGVLCWLGVLVLRHQLRNGVLSSSERDSVRGAAPTRVKPVPRVHRPGESSSTPCSCAKSRCSAATAISWSRAWWCRC